MARKRGRDALAAGRAHMAGDKPDAAEQEGQQAQQDSANQPVDNGVEDGRRAYELPEDRVQQLVSARELDRVASEDSDLTVDTNEIAFWQQLGSEMNFNPVTVEAGPDITEERTFTAWPAEPPEFSTATNEADHSADIDRIEALPGLLDLSNPRHIGANLRDTMLDIFRHRHKPWSAMSQDEQQDLGRAVDFSVKECLRRVAEVVAADRRASISAKLERYQDKGGEITAAVKIMGADDHTVLALHRASGKVVLIITADADEYLGGPDVRTDPDAPDLPFAAGSDVEIEQDDDEEEAEREYERERISTVNGMVEGQRPDSEEWEDIRPATIPELMAASAAIPGKWRVNVESGLVEFQPEGADHWDDVREATEDEIAAVKAAAEQE